MFGPERSGLDNDAIALADAILTAPVDPDFASLSLPQAVLLFAYEWLKMPEARSARTGHDLRRAGHRRASRRPRRGPPRAPSSSACSSILETALDRAGFLRPAEKRPSMVRSIRNMFHRMGATEQDVRTWRGIVSALTRGQRGQGDKGS